jgi:hypothetical protein
MDEMTWCSTTTERTWMIEHVRRTAEPRQLRLFACACVRRIWHLLPEPVQLAVDPVEQALVQRLPLETVLGQTLVTAVTMGADLSRPVRAARCIVEPDPMNAVHAATHALAAVARDTWRAELAAQCNLVRCLFGNPFRSARLDPAWLKHDRGTVVGMARAILDEGRFNELPILADALEDAGCTDEQILRHCRQPGQHGRGCWVLDLLLGSL